MVNATQRHKRETRRRVGFTALTVTYALIILFPVFWMATMVFKPETIMFARPTVWLFEPTWEHFAYVIERGFLGNLWTSFVIATLSTLLVVVVGTPAAYAFARFSMVRKDDLFLFVLATRMAPPICLVLPFYLIYAKIGLLDTHIGIILAYLTFNLSF